MDICDIFCYAICKVSHPLTKLHHSSILSYPSRWQFWSKRVLSLSSLFFFFFRCSTVPHFYHLPPYCTVRRLLYVMYIHRYGSFLNGLGEPPCFAHDAAYAQTCYCTCKATKMRCCRNLSAHTAGPGSLFPSLILTYSSIAALSLHPGTY